MRTLKEKEWNLHWEGNCIAPDNVEKSVLNSRAFWLGFVPAHAFYHFSFTKSRLWLPLKIFYLFHFDIFISQVDGALDLLTANKKDLHYTFELVDLYPNSKR